MATLTTLAPPPDLSRSGVRVVAAVDGTPVDVAAVVRHTRGWLLDYLAIELGDTELQAALATLTEEARARGRRVTRRLRG